MTMRRWFSLKRSFGYDDTSRSGISCAEISSLDMLGFKLALGFMLTVRVGKGRDGDASGGKRNGDDGSDD